MNQVLERKSKVIWRVSLGVVALIVFGMYAYQVYDFRKEMGFRRAEYSMDFLDELRSSYVIPDDRQKVLEAFNAKNFKKLEELAEQYCSERNDPEKDRGRIGMYLWALGEIGSGKHREKQIQIVKDWRANYPESIPARIVHVKLLIRVAWNVRGDGYANTVSEEQRKIFREHLFQAVDILKSIPEDQRAKYPECYANMLTCACGIGVPRDRFNGLYLEGVEGAPKCVEIHYTAAHYSTVQWGAELGEWEANLREAIKELPKDDADEVYAATIYRMVNRGHWFSKAYNTVFKPVKIDSGRVINGLKCIIAKVPEKSSYSIYYNNALAHAEMAFQNNPVACRNALEAAGWQVDLRIWNTENSFNATCREWLERRYQAYNDDIDEEEKETSPLRFFSM